MSRRGAVEVVKETEFHIGVLTMSGNRYSTRYGDVDRITHCNNGDVEVFYCHGTRERVMYHAIESISYSPKEA